MCHIFLQSCFRDLSIQQAWHYTLRKQLFCLCHADYSSGNLSQQFGFSKALEHIVTHFFNRKYPYVKKNLSMSALLLCSGTYWNPLQICKVIVKLASLRRFFFFLSSLYLLFVVLSVHKEDGFDTLLRISLVLLLSVRFKLKLVIKTSVKKSSSLVWMEQATGPR